MEDPKIVTKSQAVLMGLKKYYTGQPCKYGHYSARWTQSGKCIECKTNRDRSGRADGKKLDPSALNKRSIPMPVLDDTKLADLSRVRLTTTGLDLEDHSLSKHEWTSLAMIIEKVESFKQWLLGDLWNSCQWGDKANMMESLGLNWKTAKEYGRVARRFPYHLRRANLSFTHHQELAVELAICQKEEQLVMLLDRVESNKMSAGQVRSMMKKLAKQIDAGGDATIEPIPAHVKAFLATYKQTGKQLEDLTDVPPSLQAAMDNLIHEFKKVNNNLILEGE